VLPSKKNYNNKASKVLKALLPKDKYYMKLYHSISSLRMGVQKLMVKLEHHVN
jgi:hypothetical protein